jgi:hypothetical protein
VTFNDHLSRLFDILHHLALATTFRIFVQIREALSISAQPRLWEDLARRIPWSWKQPCFHSLVFQQ